MELDAQAPEQRLADMAPKLAEHYLSTSQRPPTEAALYSQIYGLAARQRAPQWFCDWFNTAKTFRVGTRSEGTVVPLAWDAEAAPEPQPLPMAVAVEQPIVAEPATEPVAPPISGVQRIGAPANDESLAALFEADNLRLKSELESARVLFEQKQRVLENQLQEAIEAKRRAIDEKNQEIEALKSGPPVQGFPVEVVHALDTFRRAVLALDGLVTWAKSTK
jgi:hypothetical protein